MAAGAAGLGAGVAPRRPSASSAAPRVPAHPRFLHSAALRFAAVYVLLFGLSALALAIFLWWQTAGVLDRETDNAIAADVQSLADRWNQGGLAGLIITIENRLAENVDDNAIYLLVDPSLQRVAGNLASWPTSLPLDRTWAELPIDRAGIRSLARVRRYNLPGGFHLLVGRDVQVRAELRDLLTGALLWALLVVLVLGLAGAVVIRGLFRRALADVSATAAAISAGDLSQRVRITGRGDEFDRLSETINEMLERISRLMDGVREVSNAIAHDLRTPITRARTRLEDAALHARTETDLRAAIERATADLDGVVAVFQALLRIAEIEAGARRSAFAPFLAGPLLADLVDLYGPVAEEKGILAQAAIARAAGALRGSRADPAGDRQSARQRAEILPARRGGAAFGRDRLGHGGDQRRRSRSRHSCRGPRACRRALLPRRGGPPHARRGARAGARPGGGAAARGQPDARRQPAGGQGRAAPGLHGRARAHPQGDSKRGSQGDGQRDGQRNGA